MHLKRIREEKGYGQKYIAHLLGISVGQVGNIESFKFPHKYTLKQIDTLCKNFGMPTEQLFISDESYMEQNTNITELLINKIIDYENK